MAYKSRLCCCCYCHCYYELKRPYGARASSKWYASSIHRIMKSKKTNHRKNATKKNSDGKKKFCSFYFFFVYGIYYSWFKYADKWITKCRCSMVCVAIFWGLLSFVFLCAFFFFNSFELTTLSSLRQFHILLKTQEIPTKNQEYQIRNWQWKKIHLFGKQFFFFFARGIQFALQIPTNLNQFRLHIYSITFSTKWFDSFSSRIIEMNLENGQIHCLRFAIHLCIISLYYRIARTNCIY